MSIKRQIFSCNTLRKLLGDDNSCVSLVTTTRLLALPPFFLNDMKSGILYLLNNMLKKYDRSLGGIVIGYQNIKVLMDENTGIIPMGTSETEVNISVELYIFQPKIGSLLEGVVNKKSNSHIGCLVHRYFNATILKPEDIDYDEWVCQDLNVDDRIIFKVKDLDFTSLLPLIEGVIDDKMFLSRVKKNLNRSLDLSSEIVNNVNKKCPNEVIFPQNKRKNKKDKESVIKDNMSENFLELDSFDKLKKEKKKKEEEEKELLNSLENHDQTEKNEGLDVKELIPYTLTKVNEKYDSKKKKKKDKRKQEHGKNTQESSNVTGMFAKADVSNSCRTSGNSEPVEYEVPNTCLEPDKIKEEKIKNRSETEESRAELSKTNQFLHSNEAEDEIFYSTHLDSSLPKKMEISCCSPISKNTFFEEKCQKQDLKNQAELNEKEKKQKHQKLKRKLGLEKDLTGFKKLKTSHFCSSKKESSIVQTTVEEMCRKQALHEIREDSNMSDKERSIEWKKKEKKMQNLKKNRKVQELNGGGTQQSFEINSLLDELRKQEIQRVKEELNISVRESCNEKGKTKVKKGEEETVREKTDESSPSLKNSTKTPVNGIHDSEEKLTVQNTMNHPSKEEKNREKDEQNKSDARNLKTRKKAKRAVNKEEETSSEKTHHTLYEKLLNEAKSAMDVEEDKSLVKKSRKKKKKGISKDSMVKKDENSKKKKNCCETPERYKNGSMYDAVFTPEKVNFDKSLFSDSEQSNTSPNKRTNKTNGIKADSVAQIPSKEVTEAVKNGLGKEKERISSNSEQEQESLYEKLLSEAKILIQSPNECPFTKKKEKDFPITKKKRSDCKTS